MEDDGTLNLVESMWKGLIIAESEYPVPCTGNNADTSSVTLVAGFDRFEKPAERDMGRLDRL